MAQQLQLSFHGAARTVTGSCMEFSLGESRVLVDCGMFQGSRSLEALNMGDFGFDPKAIDAVVLTHAHIDHSGRLPKLVKDGFTGPIWCTSATAELIAAMLADSGRIQEAEVARRNRRRDRAGEAQHVPLYTEQDALAAVEQCSPIERGEWFEPAPGFRARLWNAGHILGSASVELEAGGVRVMCSGDIGPDNKAFQPDPEGPQRFDHVICESTYGDREREPATIEQRRALLETEVRAAITRGGNLIIPTFALERTQELLLDLAALMHDKRLPQVPVFIDSPLADRVTRVFAHHADDLEDLGGLSVFDNPWFRFTADVQQSIRLNSLSGAIILAASGMCEAGRIRHHLLHNLARHDSTILFVGFQAAGTLGRTILDGAEMVRISGENVRVRAAIRRIDSYSAHADQGQLLAWIAAREPIVGSLMLDHGEEGAIETLRRLLQERSPQLAVRVPAIGETYALEPGKPATRIRTATPELAELTKGHDWQNSYGEFASGLRGRLNAMPDNAARKQAIEQMRRVLDSFAAHREAKRDRSEHR
ncbi:MAG: MBL fold metallo-hydrolase [Sphingomonadales bacterium]|nr:MBL fold metallo-hydrolase [Sphingomonadales bacterium]